MVSKYIGETERNLDEVFQAAEAAGSMLVFNEADALFGKRGEINDARDRYANLEVSFLLQRMESYDGVAVLSTNLLQNIDDAFSRRLSFIIRFPFPDVALRTSLWQRTWPGEAAPLDRSIDFNDLAGRYELAGGNIRNIALAAASLAASNGKIIVTNMFAMQSRAKTASSGLLVWVPRKRRREPAEKPPRSTRDAGAYRRHVASDRRNPYSAWGTFRPRDQIVFRAEILTEVAAPGDSAGLRARHTSGLEEACSAPTRTRPDSRRPPESAPRRSGLSARARPRAITSCSAPGNTGRVVRRAFAPCHEIVTRRHSCMPALDPESRTK